ncbi:SHOCT domain-containing protein [Paenibacillus sp. M1]|uniref:SHOCT domain-containing protein n=1 Tax=Paenibacillus haidiansis TaxID=1574488 RepID=A0ABU7VYN3_9BACL
MVKRLTKTNDYLFDENTIVINNNKHYEDLKRIEQLIYKLQNEPAPVAPTNQSGEDAFTKLEKLAQLKEQGIISAEEFEAKKKEILSQV